jgi:hypothetical protein
MADWEVERSSGKCAASGRELAEGEEFYAVLFDRNGVLQRVDYSIESWTGPPEGAYCFWKSRVPVKEKKKVVWVDDDVLVNLFVRLSDEKDDLKIRFRFVLALLLMRKRLLKYEQTVRDGDREYWQMRFVRESTGGGVHLVENPQLSDSQIDAVSAQLRAILQGEVPEGLAANLEESEDASMEGGGTEPGP